MMQDPPFAIQIEIVEGCSLACDFCGINGIREKPGNFKFMDLSVAALLAAQIVEAKKNFAWNPRIEFAMHGEPSLHPGLCEIIYIFRTAFGKKTSMVMFSNGTGFVKDPTTTIDRLLDHGINTLGLDAYEHVNIVPRVLAGYKGNAPIYQYPAQSEHNLHSGRRVGHRDIVVIQDISKAQIGNHSSLNTHCGGGMRPDSVLSARCAKPFRELAIRWDGNIAVCCNDFRGIYKCGNITKEDVVEIWNNGYFHAARKKLFHSDRNFGPCQWCNAKSMRVGLLPDHKGQLWLDKATPLDDALIEKACSGEPYTPPVLRGWEGDRPALMTPGTYPLNILDKKRL